ncbi:LysR family transcriptional regulator [Chromobacterium subtsugae]|uniref:LysR family transcriptional regulator n=1 Tax=Chromobacterium subtsugae TaxID=251747 RepID=UPI00064174F8|nr:LysR family transcriptional regulator [Chromobacterium subtsugae]
MEKLNGIHVFVQVAETSSFVAAGRQLGISASAVGKSIARLEERLGIRLLQRSTRHMALTAEGELFLRRCQRIFAELDAAESELAQSADRPRGRLRVSLPDGNLFNPALAEFMSLYPEVELDLDYSDRLVDLIEEGFDAAIRSGEQLDSRLLARRLGSFRLVLVAAPGYLSERGRPQRPADLQRHACLQYKFPNSGKLARWPLRPLPGEPAPLLPSTVICTNSEALIYLAQRDKGIACVPDFSVRDALADGTLELVLDGFMESSGTIRIVWSSSRQMPSRLRALIDFLAERALPDGQAS